MDKNSDFMDKLDDPKFHAEQTKGFDTGQMLRYYQEIERLKKENGGLRITDEFLAQRQKDNKYADLKEKAIEKHLNTKLTITLENFRSIFEDWNDDQRMEIIKSLIWTANNAQGFARRVQTLLDSKHFIDDID